jgi:hypothetical protein
LFILRMKKPHWNIVERIVRAATGLSEY